MEQKSQQFKPSESKGCGLIDWEFTNDMNRDESLGTKQLRITKKWNDSYEESKLSESKPQVFEE